MLNKLIRIIKQRVSPDIKWTGEYNSWEDALKKTTGYDTEKILNKVFDSIQKVLKNENWFERDGFIFKEIKTNPYLMNALYQIRIKDNLKTLNVLDFGGSLGSVFIQHKKQLDFFDNINWMVIEQSKFVDLGKHNIIDKSLSFYYNIDEIKKSKIQIDVVLISSSLQYISNPYSTLTELISLNAKYLILDLTVVSNYLKKDIITKQTIKKNIYGYQVSYPCWLFSKEKLFKFLQNKYEISQFDDSYIGNIKHKGINYKYNFIFLKRLNHI